MFLRSNIVCNRCSAENVAWENSLSCTAVVVSGAFPMEGLNVHSLSFSTSFVSALAFKRFEIKVASE